MRCIPCEENAAKQLKVQAAYREARAFMVNEGLSKVFIVEVLTAKEPTYTHCLPNDPKLFTEYHKIETVIL